MDGVDLDPPPADPCRRGPATRDDARVPPAMSARGR
jgi:hypothetical protein